MKAMRTRGWTKTQWWTLPAQERTDILRYEWQLEHQRGQMIQAALDIARNEEGKTVAEVATAQLLIALVRTL